MTLNDVMLVFAAPILNENIIRSYSLKKNIKSHPSASNSVLLSLAAHITYHFPYLDLTENPQKTPKITPEKNQINSYLTIHPLQEFWCDMFFSAIQKHHAIRKQNTLYLLIELDQQNLKKVTLYKEKLEEFTLNYQELWQDDVLKKVSGYQQLPRKCNKIAYLNVSGSQLRTDFYKPILNVRATILGQIYNNENWLNFQILKGQVPTVQQLLNFDSVIIPGSTNSVLSEIFQIQQMSQNLFKAFTLNKKLKIFGICYGHQLIAKHFKGDVVRKKRTDKIETYQVQEQKITELKTQFKFLQSFPINSNKPLLLQQHHEDYVETVPEDFHLLAKSPSSKVEMLMHNSGRILTFQSHPEYYHEFTQGYLERILRYQRMGKDLQSHHHHQVQTEDRYFMKTHRESSNMMRKVISEFLNWNFK